MDDRVWQWGELAPKQAMQYLGRGWAGGDVLGAEGLPSPC